MEKNNLIVIDGLDGSGKATQTKLLVDHLKKKYTGMDFRTLTFPDYESDSSAAVRMYLSGELGRDPSDVNAYAASSFYAIDRYISYKTKWEKYVKYNSIFIADRYTTSNAIHQLAKIEGRQEKVSFLTWLEDYEYHKLGIPTPGLVLYLDMDPYVSQQLMNERYRGQEQKKDIHEANLAYLNTSRENALFCAQIQNWEVISCSDEKRPFAIEEIHKQIVQVVENFLKTNFIITE